MKNRLATLLLSLLVAGCVTESSGGLPSPAPVSERVEAQVAVARGYIEVGNWARAKKALEKAVELDSRSVEAHVLYAVVYEAQEEFELAEEFYHKALRINGKDSQALNNFGTYLSRRGKLDEAASFLRRAVKDTEYRARPQAYENLGLVELARGDRMQAELAFRRALTLAPGQATSALELGYLAFESGDIQSADQYFDTFRKVSNPTARSLCLGMQLGAAHKNQDQVASMTLALHNLFPNSREAEQCQVQGR
ncbi:MAG: type IV pilus biogenesis/stability protein PilW [Pseudomonadales bacterium]|nr:type IV pilus biogenesis/stability protein PilW [Pseudomonadales bacterium]